MNNFWYDIYIYLHLVSNMKYDFKYDIYTYCSWVYPLTHFRVNTIMWIMLFFVHEYPMHLDWDCDAPSAWFILYDIALCQFTLFYFTFIFYCILVAIYIYMTLKHLYGITGYDILHSSSNHLILDTIQMYFKRRSHSSSNFRWLRHQVRRWSHLFPCFFRNGNLGHEPNHQRFCEIWFLDCFFLCDVSLKYVWFCPGLLYVPCVFWHHRHGGLTWLMQLFFLQRFFL